MGFFRSASSTAAEPSKADGGLAVPLPVRSASSTAAEGVTADSVVEPKLPVVPEPSNELPVTYSITAVAPEDSEIPVREYTDSQLADIDDLREYTDELILPEDDEYYPWERRFLSDPGVHARYMRAAKWHMADAKKRIKATIEWRREYRPDLIEPGEVEPENETGKIVLSGFDRQGRPLLIMRPGRQNTKESPRMVRYTVWFLERCIDLCPPGQEQLVIFLDYASISFSERTSMHMSRTVLHIMANHYVERLGRGIIVNAPWFFGAFYSAISAFIDPVSRDKVRFNPNLDELIAADQLESDYGGQVNFKYDHGVYWKELSEWVKCYEFCRLAPDGGRLDLQGRPWVAPTGLGIKHAVDQLGVESEESTLAGTANGTKEATAEPEVVAPAAVEAVAATA
ncbi:CRAL-TRIO domain-containing protein [Vanrija pseudolonga]|uniref:CRAL-TRIO domain-containing protein n=1 Tax=Vanrija pseudolonga TaxID=143232 RepID=A0AAF1BJF8_9TREE|nr:CRAL-TRIO domain-containing protein [Vanrija pseudolonga]